MLNSLSELSPTGSHLLVLWISIICSAEARCSSSCLSWILLLHDRSWSARVVFNWYFFLEALPNYEDQIWKMSSLLAFSNKKLPLKLFKNQPDCLRVVGFLPQRGNFCNQIMLMTLSTGVWIVLVTKDPSCDFRDRWPAIESQQNISALSPLNVT